MHILPLREGWRDGEQVGREHQTQGGAVIRGHGGDYETEWAAMKAIFRRGWA
jgi:hypothetical protein